MEKLIISLLIVLGILLFCDLLLQYSIFKKLSKKEHSSNFDDEKFYQLKYDIKLIKASAAIIFSLIAFLGYSNYKDFKAETTNKLNDIITVQNDSIQRITNKINDISFSIKTMESLKDTLSYLIETYKNNLTVLSKKINDINKTFKHNPHIYIVTDLTYDIKNIDSLVIYFKDLKTIHGEKLPKFSRPPFVNIQGHLINMEVANITRNYIVCTSGSVYGIPSRRNVIYKFDLWIAAAE